MAKIYGFYQIKDDDNKRTFSDLLAEAKKEPVENEITRQAVANYVYLTTARQRKQEPTGSGESSTPRTFADYLNAAPKTPIK